MPYLERPDVHVEAPHADPGDAALRAPPAPPASAAYGTVVLTAMTEGDYFGESVSGAGDVDGDGYADLLVGAPEYGIDEGQAYVWYGSGGGIGTTFDAALVPATGTYEFGWSASAAGDVDGDGIADALVGAARGFPKGGVIVYYGSACGISAAASTTIYGPKSAVYVDAFGSASSGAGDVNGDGYDDVIVGDDYYDGGSSRGAALVYLGSSDGIATSPDTTLTDAGEDMGEGVSGAGDFNGDGYDDVLVGNDFTSGDKGAVYLYLGSSTGIAAAPDSTVTGEAYAFGYQGAMSGAGDVDADGYDDLVIGAPNHVTDGVAFIYLGNADGTLDAYPIELSSTELDSFGLAVSGAGDVNADGYADLLVSAQGADGGVVSVYEGSSGGPVDTAIATFVYGDRDSSTGWPASGAGDVDGDGLADLVVGAVEEGTSLGHAYVYESGGESGVDTGGGTACDTGDSASGGEETGAEDTSAEDTGAEDTGAEDTSAEDTGGESSAEETGAEDTSAEDTSAEDTSGNDTAEEDTGGGAASAKDTGRSSPGCGCAETPQTSGVPFLALLALIAGRRVGRRRQGRA